ncbi:MAG TPA: ABC-F family ATP-binding cassette domain-containing protein [Spirochaetota bacterium]|nr:ABC-F family ATP-binding cassette domain-containing protein [Spirochaetota bacterium]HNT09911.1 ABC-F family ATP-binding cassette domain-containing protein [Spirochaetota bacterium]
MIFVENLSKSYGRQLLFDAVSFRVNPRERIGLVGRNGHGKTTLFRIITGEEGPDEGSVSIPRNYRMGYLQQHLAFSRETAVAEGALSLPDEERGETWRVEKVLSGLGFGEREMRCHPRELSGGYQIRLNLAKVLIAEPDMLLLDEPNNYLDITSIRWLERFLTSWKGELVLITHDRTFMDNVVTHTMGIHRRKLRKVAGGTDKLYSQIAMEEEIYEKTRANDEQRRKEIELFVTRFRAKARLGGLVQSRVKMLEKMGQRDKLENIKTLDFSFIGVPFTPQYIATIEDLSFGYETDRPLITGLSMSIRARDRICVVGKNGRGKTTLLKLIAGALAPDAGRVSINPKAVMGYYEQSNVQVLKDSRSVLDEVMNANPGLDRTRAWTICGSMMFEGDDALKKIAVLSGGEKSRVLLGRIIAAPVNLLLLDEPTNHLDMESCDALLAAIDNFDGAVIMVTHNEMYLNALADRLIVFHNDTVRAFEGGYQRFLEKGGWGDEEAVLRQDAPSKPAGEGRKIGKAEARKIRSKIVAERARALKPLETKVSEIEGAIQRLEKELESHTGEIVTASQEKNGKRVSELSQLIHRCRAEIDARFDELEESTLALEQASAHFDALLSEVEG